MDDHRHLLDEISTLLAAPADGAAAPAAARLEHTLTDGYARALTLEAEHARLERRIAEVARSLADDPARAEQLPILTRRLAEAERELAELRGLLRSLRRRALAA